MIFIYLHAWQTTKKTSSKKILKQEIQFGIHVPGIRNWNLSFLILSLICHLYDQCFQRLLCQLKNARHKQLAFTFKVSNCFNTLKLQLKFIWKGQIRNLQKSPRDKFVKAIARCIKKICWQIMQSQNGIKKG